MNESFGPIDSWVAFFFFFLNVSSFFFFKFFFYKDYCLLLSISLFLMYVCILANLYTDCHKAASLGVLADYYL